MKRLVVVAIIAISGLAGAAFGSASHVESQPCHYEDEILVGQGDFVSGQGWSDGWHCIAADDL